MDYIPCGKIVNGTVQYMLTSASELVCSVVKKTKGFGNCTLVPFFHSIWVYVMNDHFIIGRKNSMFASFIFNSTDCSTHRGTQG